MAARRPPVAAEWDGQMEAMFNVNMCPGMVFGGTNAAAGVFLNINITIELGTEDVNAFQNFLRMHPKLFKNNKAIVSALARCTLVTPY